MTGRTREVERLVSSGPEATLLGGVLHHVSRLPNGPDEIAHGVVAPDLCKPVSKYALPLTSLTLEHRELGHAKRLDEATSPQCFAGAYDILKV